MEIVIHALNKNYGHHKALNHINLTIGNGLIGLLGPNGAGKTTLMQILATLLPPSSGEVTICGFSLGRDNQDIRKLIGFLPQSFGVYKNLTAEEFLQFVATVKGFKDKLLRNRMIIDILEKVNLIEHSNKKIKTYSGGMKQRVGIAQALIGNPSVLIIDEPTVGLDPEERLKFKNLLMEVARNSIVLLSTHIVSDIEDYCSHLCIMQKGNMMFYGKQEELLDSLHGKVWLATLDYEEWQHSSPIGKVIGKKIRKNSVELKIYSSDQPLCQAVNFTPSLEDAYMILTGGGSDGT